MSSAIGLCVLWRLILLTSLPLDLNSFLISGIKKSFTNSRKGFFSIGGSLTGFTFAFTGTLVDISLGIFETVSSLFLGDDTSFLFSSKIFSFDISLLDLSIFLADLLLAIFILGSEIVNLLTSLFFSFDISSSTLSIFSANLLLAVSDLGSAGAESLSSDLFSLIN